MKNDFHSFEIKNLNSCFLWLLNYKYKLKFLNSYIKLYFFLNKFKKLNLNMSFEEDEKIKFNDKQNYIVFPEIDRIPSNKILMPILNYMKLIINCIKKRK